VGPRVGLLWRREWDPPQPDGVDVVGCRLRGVFAAFAELGTAAEPVVFADDALDAVRAQLLELDGVLVWVNPIEQGLDRSRLDALLRDVAAAGVWVSAHPDVIARMATKTVLVDTRAMSWSSDTRLYVSSAQLRDELPSRLGSGPRVLKQQRGMGGQGVWKVELRDGALTVQDASGDGAFERVSLDDFVRRCEPYFAGGAAMVEQPFQERIGDGMIRVYLTHDRVVGFAHQYPRGLRPASAGEPPPGKVFDLPNAPQYAALREQMEREWVPELQRLLDLNTYELPVIWDADFLYGPRSADGEDSYVLCEINASSTFAFPEHAMPTVARAALDRIRRQAS
jgi:uncharacterized protein DUF6815